MVSAWAQDCRALSALAAQSHGWFLIQPKEHVCSALNDLKLLCLIDVVMEWGLNDRRAIFRVGWRYCMRHQVRTALLVILN